MDYTNVAIVYGVTKWPEEDHPLSSLYNRSTRTSFVKIDEPDIKRLAVEIRRSIADNFRGKGGRVGIDDVALKVEEELKKSALVHGGVESSADRQPRYAITIYNASLPEVTFRGRHLNRRDFYAPEPKGVRLVENVVPLDVLHQDYNYNFSYLAETHTRYDSPTIEEHFMRMRKKERDFKVIVNPVWSTDKQFFSFNKN